MDYSNKRILVTGGAGFIGSHLVDRLAKDNDVTVVDNLSSGRLDNLKEDPASSAVHFLEADVRDRRRMEEVTRGMDVVFHLAAACLRASIADPYSSHEVNAGGSLSVCAGARKSKVARFIYVSSSEVYGSAITAPMKEDHPCYPRTVYGASKLAGEAYARAFYFTYELPVTVVRPFNTYGPREPYWGVRAELLPRTVINVLGGQPPVIFGDGSQTRDFTYVTEIAEGILQAAACDELVGETVNIARGKEVSVKEMVGIVLEEADRQDLVPRFHRPRPGDVLRHFADISKARKTLHFNPVIDMREGIKKYVHWLKNQSLDFEQLSKEQPVFNW